jgi:hypothetical protein
MKLTKRSGLAIVITIAFWVITSIVGYQLYQQV